MTGGNGDKALSKDAVGLLIIGVNEANLVRNSSLHNQVDVFRMEWKQIQTWEKTMVLMYKRK